MINKKFWKNKKVLVTGHSGFTGTWLPHCYCYLNVILLNFSKTKFKIKNRQK